MGESKHTPGPWEVSDHADATGTCRVEAPDAGDIIAECIDPSNAPIIAAAPLMLEAHEANDLDAHDALARLPSIEWVGHAETRDIMALIAKLRERLVAIARRSDAAIKAATGGET